MTDPTTLREALANVIHRDNPNLLWGEANQAASRLAPKLEAALAEVGKDTGWDPDQWEETFIAKLLGREPQDL